MAAGVKTGGRTKGTPNRISATVRENVIEVFDRLGGVRKMAEWAGENATEFYRLYARLLPTETTVNIHRDARELSDADLADIATGRSDGIIGATPSPQEPSSVH